MDAYRVEKVGMRDADFAELSRGILKRGASLRFKAHGSSMVPLIRDGDLLTIRPLKPWDVIRGDVVLYQTVSEKCVVHRVVKIDFRNEQRIFVTKGDASPGSVEEIEEDRVLGCVVHIHRNERCINLNRNVWWILSRHLPGFLQISYLIERVQRKIFPDRYGSNSNSDFQMGKE
jgi:signal peptidase I